jgi:ribosomal protein S18 acetylase RimI-like enzyme
MSDGPVRISTEELPAALAHALATPPDYRPAPRSAIDAFMASAEHSTSGWIGYRVGSIIQPRGLVVALRLKGRTVLMLPAPLGLNSPQPDETAAALRACLAALEGMDFVYAQTIIPPEQVALGGVIESTGFTRLTELMYLERDARFPWLDAPPAETEWVEYSEQTHARFCECITRTYEGTQDCPELVGLRTIEDTIASHKAAGPFNPALWNLLLTKSEPAGVLLCANHARTFEIVYTGLIPERRGLGLGQMLMRRAVAQARWHGIRNLTVAVDERNRPAIRLYEKNHFEPIARRVVHLLCTTRLPASHTVSGS